MIRHEEGGALHGHGLVTARACGVHLAARDTLEKRERCLAVWTGSERCVRHVNPFVVRLG